MAITTRACKDAVFHTARVVKELMEKTENSTGLEIPGLHPGDILDPERVLIGGADRLRRAVGPLDVQQFQDFQTVVGHHADDIVRKWIDYFVLHRSVQSEVITRRIK